MSYNFFKMVKEIRSRTGELHFQRYAILETTVFSIYIHRIFKEDKDLHLHSHPWNFVSMILKGAYMEKYLSTDIFREPQVCERLKSAGTFSSGDRKFFHKIQSIVSGPVYSLFITYGKRKYWYYNVDGDEIESPVYFQMKHTTGFNVPSGGGKY